jgi:hypothetical protein
MRLAAKLTGWRMDIKLCLKQQVIDTPSAK